MTVRFIILNGENDRLTYKYVSRILGTYQGWGGHFCDLESCFPRT